MDYEKYRLTDAEYAVLTKNGVRVKAVMDAQIDKVLRIVEEEAKAKEAARAAKEAEAKEASNAQG